MYTCILNVSKGLEALSYSLRVSQTIYNNLDATRIITIRIRIHRDASERPYRVSELNSFIFYKSIKKKKILNFQVLITIFLEDFGKNENNKCHKVDRNERVISRYASKSVFRIIIAHRYLDW